MNLNNIFTKLPSDINCLINSFLYENNETIKSYREKWNFKNKKQLVIIDKINIPNNKECKHHLTLKDYNEFPCWYCKKIHVLRICIHYMKDISIINKIYNNTFKN